MTAKHQEPPNRISIASPNDLDHLTGSLGALLYDCVNGGASINFVLPFSQADSIAFWRSKVFPQVREGTRKLWIAQNNGMIAGSVQLDIDTPPNQPHRAEVTKLMVHPDFRRRGFARSLMTELELFAGLEGRTLITLDTRTGDMAEPLYASMGYQTAGIIPGYCRDTVEDRLDPTTFMYKTL